jgi:hypothetical protein
MNTLPRRESKTAAELAAALNKGLQAHPECHGIKLSKLVPLTNTEVGLANWDAEFNAEPGVAMSPECKRLALAVKHGVQKHFDLAGES